MMNKKRMTTIAVVLFTAALSLFAANRGSDLIYQGELKTIEGQFITENNEWYVVTNTAKYLIHKGPVFYTDEIGLKMEENSVIKVNGYIDKNDITPVDIYYNGKNYTFRDETGRPKWSGKGNQRNRR